MPRFLFKCLDPESGQIIETDWLELPDPVAACRAADKAVREAAAEMSGTGVVSITVLDSTGSLIHRAEVEIRSFPYVKRRQ